MTHEAKAARWDLRHRQNEAHGFAGLHGAKRVARGDYMGGYAHYVVTTDGALLCGACVREEWRSIVWSTRHNMSDGWNVAGITHDGELEGFNVCDHCGRILSDDDEA